MSTIYELADVYNTDKGYKHGYTVYYDRHFECMRDKDIKLLEIGIDKAASIKVWLDYFVSGKVYCVDILPESVVLAGALGRCSAVLADQSNLEDLIRIASFAPFDIVIDDGSHFLSDIIGSFDVLYESLRDGGIYVVEDLNARRTKTSDAFREHIVLNGCRFKFYCNDTICFVFK